MQNTSEKENFSSEQFHVVSVQSLVALKSMYSRYVGAASGLSMSKTGRFTIEVITTNHIKNKMLFILIGGDRKAGEHWELERNMVLM